MPVGPGKYDELCTYVREQAEASLVVVIIAGGNKGQGFCVQAINPTLGGPQAIASLLRATADAIEKESGAS